MATQITHIALADKVFDRYFSSFDRKEFYVGTVFPDIRYLGEISRDQTHLYQIDLAGIKSEASSFEAGRKYHCLIDLVREEFLEKAGLYEMMPEMPDRYSVPKFLEDEVLYARVTRWPEIIGYLNEPLKAELAYGVSEGCVEKWHKNL